MLATWLMALSQISATAPTPALDSVVLERSACFGSCPTYRLSITAKGNVHFQQTIRGVSSDHSGSVSDSLFRLLADSLNAVTWQRFPTVLSRNQDWCHINVSEGSDVKVSVFWGDAVSRVVDFTTCTLPKQPTVTPGVVDNRTELDRLRRIERLIDVVGGRMQWLLPDPGPQNILYLDSVPIRVGAPVVRWTPPAIDSFVLVRGPCWRLCTAYRLSVARNGEIAFRSVRQNTRLSDSLVRLLTDSIRALVPEQYPQVIPSDNSWCGGHLSDGRDVTFEVFSAGSVIRVADYSGCLTGEVPSDHGAKLKRLRAFEDFIDTVVGTKQLLNGG